MRVDNNRLHPLSAHIHYPIYTDADEARKNYYSYLQMPITTLKYADGQMRLITPLLPSP
jgi:hypothetical protein